MKGGSAPLGNHPLEPRGIAPLRAADVTHAVPWVVLGSRCGLYIPLVTGEAWCPLRGFPLLQNVFCPFSWWGILLGDLSPPDFRIFVCF